MIGVFDSGLGGLTVVREIERQLPGHDIIYFGDTARTPYGTKSRQLIGEYALQDARFLLEQGAKLLVVACNTVSAQAVDLLRESVDVPVFEVVMPAVRRAVSMEPKQVGVIGTLGTVRSGVYEREISRLSPLTEVHAVPCPLFVPLVEEGWVSSPETLAIAREYLRPLRLERSDALILGCTHYPFLRPVIRQAIGPDASLIDPARETAAELADFLKEEPTLGVELRSGRGTLIYVSDLTERFVELTENWLGRQIEVKEVRID